MMLNCIVLYIGGNNKERFFFPKSLIPFYIYGLSIPIFVATLIGATTHFLGSFLTPILFGLNLILLLPHLKVEYIYKYYKIIVLFACVVFIMQEVSYYTIGHRFGALIPFLDLYNGIPASQYMSQKISFSERSCSIFVEPSHFGQYLAPFLALEINKLNNKGSLLNIYTIFITIVLIVLRSGNGLFLCAIIWLFAFLFSKMKVIKKLFFILPLAAAAIYIGYGYVSTSEEGEKTLQRVEQLDVEQDRVSSGMIRLYRGFFVFDEMPIEAKVFGVGAGGADYMIDNSVYHWMFASEEDHYLNNSSFFLIAYGYIGTLLFLLFLIDIIKRKHFLSTVIVAGYITLSLMESFVFETRMLLYIGLASLALVDNSKEFGVQTLERK
jgi:hypothetical protein